MVCVGLTGVTIYGLHVSCVTIYMCLTGLTVCGMCVSDSVTIYDMCVSDRCFVLQTTTQRASHSLTEFLPSALTATECSSDITRLWKKMDPWQKSVSGALFQEMSGGHDTDSSDQNVSFESLKCGC